ncbi:unnamed protein product [Alopecurus aequalis]
MTHKNNSPPISSFSPSYSMQEFRCAEKNQYNQHQYYASPTYAQEIYQEQPQFGAQSTPLEEQSSWMDEIKKTQQELMDQLNSLNEQVNNMFSQTATPEPAHHPQELVPMELNDPPEVQAPTRELDDTDKLSLLYLEYTWSAEDDPLRPVIVKEMKKIKDGSDLVEELKKIEKNMNLSNSISSLLELELSALEILLDTCEGTEPSHTSERANESPEVELSLVPEGQNSQLERASEEEAIALEDESEIKEDLPLVMVEGAFAGLSNPLDNLFPCKLSALTLHHMIPSLTEELKNDLLNLDKGYSVSHIAHTHNDDNYYQKDIITCSNISHIFHVDTYHPQHVLYCYTYIIGYSIDDLVGVNPIACASFAFCECTFRILLVHYSLRPKMVRVDIPWDPGGCMSW